MPEPTGAWSPSGTRENAPMPTVTIEEIDSVVAGANRPEVLRDAARLDPHAARAALDAAATRPGVEHVDRCASTPPTAAAAAAGLRAAGRRARRPDAADDAQPARLPLVRPGRPVPAGHTGQHLQLLVARGDPVPRRARRGRDRDRRGRRLPRADPQGPRRAARGSSRSTSSTRRPTGCPTACQPASELMTHGVARPRTSSPRQTSPDDIATLIYTSGTTGPPKGVMISQYNVVYTVEQLRRCIDFDNFVGKRVVSYLPMAHIAERMMSHYQWMILGYSVYCCPDPSQLAAYLNEVRPEIGVRRAAGVGEDLQRRQRRARRRPGAQGEVRRGPRRRAGDQGRPSATAPPPRSSSTRGRSSTPSPSPPCARWSGSTRWRSPSPAPRRSRVPCSSGTTRSACRSARSTA